jgi:anti-sigma factor RsiW
MKCKRTERLLSDYIAGVIAPRRAESLREHLRACPSCAAKLEGLERVVRAAAASGQRTVPCDCWPAVRARLLAGEIVARGIDLRRRWGAAIAGVAATMAVTTAVILSLPQSPPTARIARRAQTSVATRAGVEREYLEAYAAFRDGRPLASEDGAVIVSTADTGD